MTDLNDIKRIIYFSFTVDGDCQDGEYDPAKREKAGDNTDKTLQKIWRVFYGLSAPDETHEKLPKPKGYSKLSIRRPNNKEKTLLVFRVREGGYFDKDRTPIVCREGKGENVFLDSFVLAPDYEAETMKIILPRKGGPSFPDKSWAGLVFDDEEFEKKLDSRASEAAKRFSFAFNIEIEKVCPPTDTQTAPVKLEEEPDDPWPPIDNLVK